MTERDFDDSNESYALRRIADALDELLYVYKAHVRLTAKSAQLGLAPLGDAVPPDVLAVLKELEEVTR